MCALCRMDEGTVCVSSLSGISKRAPSRHGLLSGSSGLKTKTAVSREDYISDI